MNKFWLAVCILLLSPLSWAPTCGGGPSASIYHISDIHALGLAEVASYGPVLSILNATDNSPIETNLRYYCYAGGGCAFSRSQYSYDEIAFVLLPGTTPVILLVNDSGSVRTYHADLVDNGTGGMENCGGPAYVIENIKPGYAPDYSLILAVSAFSAVILVAAIIVKRYFKETRKSDRD